MRASDSEVAAVMAFLRGALAGLRDVKSNSEGEQVAKHLHAIVLEGYLHFDAIAEAIELGRGQ